MTHEAIYSSLLLHETVCVREGEREKGKEEELIS